MCVCGSVAVHRARCSVFFIGWRAHVRRRRGGREGKAALREGTKKGGGFWTRDCMAYNLSQNYFVFARERVSQENKFMCMQ